MIINRVSLKQYNLNYICGDMPILLSVFTILNLGYLWQQKMCFIICGFKSPMHGRNCPDMWRFPAFEFIMWQNR